MIQSRADYKAYITQDQIARGLRFNSPKQRLKDWVYRDPTWKFQKLLRRTEFYFNKKKNPLEWLYYWYLEYRFKKLSIKLGFSIPKNVFGPGLAIPHYGLIVVNSKTKVGKNCRIHVGVNIGASGGFPEAPQIGDNVYIGPGAKIYGNISIANNVAIAANASVGRSIEEEHIVVGGIPAKKIKEFDIKQIIKHLESE
ncbi:MAG: serine acetyltransferase [Flavobacteriaceae bacterium]|nr:serine acetyltransferase [Flavobacteriaceae bacterium]